ncbi:MAG: FmdB family zinc ribbon protein [Candidatus Krumholzibacteriota bacterium]
MPTYEYECTRCGLITEEFKPMSAPRRQRCPECRGKVERLISGGMGVHFKGSGFYINDSRGKMSTGGGESTAPAKSESKADKKSD